MQILKIHKSSAFFRTLLSYRTLVLKCIQIVFDINMIISLLFQRDASLITANITDFTRLFTISLNIVCLVVCQPKGSTCYYKAVEAYIYGAGLTHE